MEYNTRKKDSKLKLGYNEMLLGTQQSAKNGRQRIRIKNDGTVENTRCVVNMIWFKKGSVSIYSCREEK